jgi:hypothetical protein
MNPTVAIRRALSEPDLLGNALKGDSFLAMRTLLIAAMGEPLINDAERAMYTKLTRRETSPRQRVNELVIVAGRRGSKSRGLSVLATYCAGLCDWSDCLVPGETGVVLALAQDKKVAKQILDYTEAIFAGSPILKQMVVKRTAETIELKNHIKIEVRSASMSSLRGPTYVCILLDELAFWYTDELNADPDTEIIAAVTPGLLTTRGMMVLASSPYRRKGILWERYKKHYGENGAASVLVAQGTTRDFNPTIEQAEIDRLLADDPAKNAAEYLAVFRTDLESLIGREVVEACVIYGTFELPYDKKKTYFAFCDAATGSGGDSFTLAIAHMEYGKETVTIDVLREIKPPFSFEASCKEFSDAMRKYNISFVICDKFGGDIVVEQFGKFGIRCEQSAKTKSELYLDMLTVISSGRVELLDHDRSINQIVSLERRNRSGGRPSIDAPQGQHEDIANSIAGVISITLFKYGSYNLAALGEGFTSTQSLQILQERKERAAIAAKHGSNGRVDYIFDDEATLRKPDPPVYRDQNGFLTDIKGNQILDKDGKPRYF